MYLWIFDCIDDSHLLQSPLKFSTLFRTLFTRKIKFTICLHGKLFVNIINHCNLYLYIHNEQTCCVNRFSMASWEWHLTVDGGSMRIQQEIFTKTWQKLCSNLFTGQVRLWRVRIMNKINIKSHRNKSFVQTFRWTNTTSNFQGSDAVQRSTGKSLEKCHSICLWGKNIHVCWMTVYTAHIWYTSDLILNMRSFYLLVAKLSKIQTFSPLLSWKHSSSSVFAVILTLNFM